MRGLRKKGWIVWREIHLTGSKDYKSVKVQAMDPNTNARNPLGKFLRSSQN
jgi:hypothetical protein